MLDSNHDGFIESTDFEAIGENVFIMLGIELDTHAFRQIEELSEKLRVDIREYTDKKRGNKCSIDEWLSFADEQIVNCDEEWYNNYINSIVSGLFDMFDSNSDGLISDIEYINLFTSFRIEVRFASKCFKQLDTNNDGYISRDELVTAIKEFMRSDKPDTSGNSLFGDLEN
ncbi:MAG: EF-hand domain-containing protein [Bacteroidetes bacterium]|nr:EF-hand domain-containing protein [Bacteroidota bacterium]